MKKTSFLLSLSVLLITGCNTAETSTTTSNPVSSFEEPIPLIDGQTYEYEIADLNCKRDEYQIYGQVYTPVKEGEKPAIILCHSAGLNCDSLKTYAGNFAERGFVSVIFDFCGGSNTTRSGMSQKDMTIFTEVEDVQAVYDSVLSLPEIDEENIFLFGTSQGGLVSAIYGSQHPTKVKGMILFYPAFNIPELVSSFFEGQEIPDNIDSLFMQTGKEYVTSLLDYDVYSQLEAFANPVLIVTGSKDFIAPTSYSLKAQEKFPCCEVHEIEGAAHGFNKENFSMFGDYDQEAFAYVDEYLGRFPKQGGFTCP